MVEIQQAVILAGGRGTRLRPFSDTAPKAMYPFEGKPFLEHLIEQIKSFGIRIFYCCWGICPKRLWIILAMAVPWECISNIKSRQWSGKPAAA